MGFRMIAWFFEPTKPGSQTGRQANRQADRQNALCRVFRGAISFSFFLSFLPRSESYRPLIIGDPQAIDSERSGVDISKTLIRPPPHLQYACSTSDVVRYCHDSRRTTFIDCDTCRVDLLCCRRTLDYC